MFLIIWLLEVLQPHVKVKMSKVLYFIVLYIYECLSLFKITLKTKYSLKI